MPICRQRAIRLAAAGAGEMARRAERARQGPGTVAEAEAQEMTAHGARFSAATAGAWAGGSLSRYGATRRWRAQVRAQTATEITAPIASGRRRPKRSLSEPINSAPSAGPARKIMPESAMTRARLCGQTEARSRA